MWMMIIKLILTYFATVTFGVLINVPRRGLNAGGIISTLGFLAYLLCLQAGAGIAIANLIGALLIGVLSMQAARWLKMPVINFNIPSMVPFVPGGQAYQMVKNFALGDNAEAMSYFLQVAVIAGAIAFGFLLAELFNRLQAKVMLKLSNEWRREHRNNPKL